MSNSDNATFSYVKALYELSYNTTLIGRVKMFLRFLYNLWSWFSRWTRLRKLTAKGKPARIGLKVQKWIAVPSIQVGAEAVAAATAAESSAAGTGANTAGTVGAAAVGTGTTTASIFALVTLAAASVIGVVVLTDSGSPTRRALPTDRQSLGADAPAEEAYTIHDDYSKQPVGETQVVAVEPVIRDAAGGQAPTDAGINVDVTVPADAQRRRRRRHNQVTIDDNISVEDTAADAGQPRITIGVTQAPTVPDVTPPRPMPPAPKKEPTLTVNENRLQLGRGSRTPPTPSTVITQMQREALKEAITVVKFCIDTRGGVASTAVKQSSGIEVADVHALEVVKARRYRIFREEGEAIPVCTHSTVRLKAP